MSILAAYEACIDEKLAQWKAMPKKTPVALETIAAWLGCAHISHSRGYCVNNPEQPASECEPVVINALVTLLHARGPRNINSDELDTVVLDGLLRSERWKTRSGDEAFMYEFATLITRFCDATTSSKGESNLHVRQNRLRAEVARTLTCWLAPRSEAPKLSSQAIADALFGPAWVSIVRSVDSTSHLGELILTHKPPFRSGLWLPGVTEAQAALPELDPL
jgi:hypothetical protein